MGNGLHALKEQRVIHMGSVIGIAQIFFGGLASVHAPPRDFNGLCAVGFNLLGHFRGNIVRHIDGAVHGGLGGVGGD